MTQTKGTQQRSPRRLQEVHLVCRGENRVHHRGDGTFISGSRVLKPEHIREGVVFALHETRAKPSYLQGVALRVERTREETTPSGMRRRRIDILVRATSRPLAWAGKGAGEKGLVWG